MLGAAKGRAMSVGMVTVHVGLVEALVLVTVVEQIRSR
jgi:hypothetical protein